MLHLDDLPVVVGRLGRPPCPAPAGDAGRPGPPDPAELVGRGDGLTPYGDDVLCGWLAIHRAAGVPSPGLDDEVRRLLPRTTLLSATLLRLRHPWRGDPRVRGVRRLARHAGTAGGRGRADRGRPHLGRGAARGRALGAGRMTHCHVELRPGAYADSVTLLQVSRAVQDLPGVVAAQVAMATTLNIDVLTGMGFEVPGRGHHQRPGRGPAARRDRRPGGGAGRRGAGAGRGFAPPRRRGRAGPSAHDRLRPARRPGRHRADLRARTVGDGGGHGRGRGRARRDDLQRQRARRAGARPQAGGRPRAACW